jgi:hypothetical protein
MNNLSPQTKRGVSEVVAYVFLIIIAIGIATSVFYYLKVLIPKDKPECSQEIHLIVSDSSCKILNSTTAYLNVTILNKGLFTADAAYIRFDSSGVKVKKWINKDDERLVPGGLLPDQSVKKSFIVQFSQQSNELEIEPAEYQDNLLVACEKAIITQKISCA